MAWSYARLVTNSFATPETAPATDSIAEAKRAGAAAEMPAPLRRRVRLLGELLGIVISETDGPDVLADVERLRAAVIDAHDQPASRETVLSVIEGYTLERAEQVARAFTVYFQLANIAEERERLRALRERDSGETPLPESLRSAVSELAGSSSTEQSTERLRAMLTELLLHPVLTAHPTEARRRAVVSALTRAGEQLELVDAVWAGNAERAEARRRLLEEITVLWRTAQLRAHRPGPLDEVRTAMAVFDETLFRVVPTVYRALDSAVLGERSGVEPPAAPAYIRFGSWIGADRDGNPYVTADVTRDTMAIQSEHVLRALEIAATRIGRTLTLDERVTPANESLQAALDIDAGAHPRLLADLDKISPGEPHRKKMLLIAARIAATRQRDADLAYGNPEELLEELRLVQRSLSDGGVPRAAFGEVQHLIWQVETFGFHLAELEIRQHSSVHARVLEELGVDAGDAVALERLAEHGWSTRPTDLSELATEVLATLRGMAAIQARHGVRACRRYIVSFSRSAADLMAVRALARLAVGDRPLQLEVIPLFETQADLAASVPVLEEYVAIPRVAAELEAAGRCMEVMLGYSDSAKDVGPVTAALQLYETQANLVTWARRNNITLTLFHGRGGALGRGGGPANRAVLSQAPGSLGRRFKVTEQGEVIFARYGHRAIGERHFEQVSSAVLMASTPEVEGRAAAAAARYAGLAQQISVAARTKYHELVRAHDFAAYFSKVSPLEELSGLRIGSRPARRGGAPSGLEDLRAIPWVFAWGQTRCNLPGWYGLGSGLAAVPDEQVLREAYREWPLFAAMLDNAEMSLAKADANIARRYLELGDRPDLTEQILDELALTTDRVLSVTGHRRLLEHQGILSWAVELRNPYVDALSYLQLRALRALRAGEADDATRTRLQELVLLTVNGVAAGLQNTG